MTRPVLLSVALLAACNPPVEQAGLPWGEEGELTPEVIAFADPDWIPGDPGAWPVQDHNVYRTTDGRIEVYFTNPGTVPGGGEDPLLDDAVIGLLDGGSSIDAAWYEFTRAPIVDAIARAHGRGASIDFAGDGDEAADIGYVKLNELGVPFAMRPPRDRIMHDKFAVIDDRWLFTGSTNMSENDVMRNNNGSLKIDDPTLAALYQQELAQMRGGLFGRKKAQLDPNQTFTVGGHEIDVYFSPGDPHQAILDALDTAQQRVYFMIFSFTRQDIADKLIALHQQGVEVVGIFDESQAAGRYSVDEKLALAGIPVYIDGNGNASGFAGGKLHHKTVIIDPLSSSTPTVTVGSYNWSEGASEYNDENLLVLRGPEIPAAYTDQFCAILAVATPHPSYTGELVDPCAALMVKLRVNEILANPEGTDEGKEFVEIVNVGQAPVNLAGWKLGDGSATRHVFGSVDLAPGEAIVVADGATTAPKFEIASTGTLSLANNADEVVLRDADDVVVDRVAYVSPASGTSFNREPDWADEGPFGLHPNGGSSPGTRADGSAAAKTVIFNEVMYNPSGTESTNEFVELVNTSHLPVDIAGWTLWDETTTTPRHTFASPTVIGPGQHLLVWGGGTHAEPGLVLSITGGLSLNNTGTIANPAGVTLRTGATSTSPIADQLTWTVAGTDGVSMNRSADGSRSATWVAHSTMPEAQIPDASPRLSSPGTRADGTAFGGRVMINEVMADPAGTDTGMEWIELVNVSNLPADISGWMVGDAVNPARHVFPPNTVLQPLDVIVLFDSGSHTDIPGAIVASTGALALNNTSELVTVNDAAGHQRDAVTWKSATSGVSFNRSTDLDPNAPLSLHSAVTGAVPSANTAFGHSSPGLRVDQSDF